MKRPFTWVRSSLLIVTFFLLFHGIPIAENHQNSIPINTIRFVHEFIIPNDKQFKGTTIGGLSGIDYDKDNDIYYLISDDRSALNAARFYKAKIHITPSGIDSVQFLDVQSIRRHNGKEYPSARQLPGHAPDPEAIRYNTKAKSLVWSSEGERILKDKDTVLTNPSIHIMKPDGKFTGSFSLPASLRMHTVAKGPRQNGALEGITFNHDYSMLYTAVEEPLYEDGPSADIMETDSWIRIYGFSVATKTNTYQYAYKLDPVAHPASPEDAFKINGVSEILSLGDQNLLVIERSFSTGRSSCTIKIFRADLSKADNIMSVASLKDTPPLHAAIKTPILNMDDLGIYIDNIEGVTLGPDLPNGHKTLIFVSDNNFLSHEKTQLLLFEIIP